MPANVMKFWRLEEKIAGLAACENVVAKLGGINMKVNGFEWHKNSKLPTSEELCEATRPYYEYTIEQFGVDRRSFESNFPVDKIMLQLSHALELVQGPHGELFRRRKDKALS